MSVLGFLGKLLGIGAVLLAVLVAVVIYFAFKKPGKAPAADKVTPLVRQGGADLTELKRMTTKVKDAEIRALGEAVAARAEAIIRELKKQPEEAKKLSQFFNYYLPTLGKILGKYAQLEASGAVADNVR
ncbi:MAG: 5-bromo-4-chloroindolyl phosphate hydrolysis family protein, partial [Oscillospiraceae bacterium]|nr:5-bromo-4-chloroindolyl phosphate hydrolysis family protein [Oscillospiraceae bacterium]